MCAIDDEPSAYTEWLARHDRVPRAGLFHHFLLETDDFTGTYDRLIAAGCTEGLRATAPDGRQVAYLDATEITGSYVELVQRTGRATRFVDAMREICAAWDGTNPLRSHEEFASQVEEDDRTFKRGP